MQEPKSKSKPTSGQPPLLHCTDCGTELVVDRNGGVEPCPLCICKAVDAGIEYLSTEWCQDNVEEFEEDPYFADTGRIREEG